MRGAPGNGERSTQALHAALLDYSSAPGKYQLSLREPAILFASIREILQIASGRGATGERDAEDDRLRQAAMFFIRAALLFPGANHYAVLGLSGETHAKDLKERYRLLIRLTHPDYAGQGTIEWPADAAMRVNRAYEVLSSRELQRAYDEELAALPTRRESVVSKAVALVPTPRKPDARPSRKVRKLAWAMGITGGAVAVVFLAPRQEPDYLVQRGATVKAPPVEVAAAAPAAAPHVQPAPAAAKRAERAPAAQPQARTAAQAPASAARPAAVPSPSPPRAQAHAPAAAPVVPVAPPAAAAAVAPAGPAAAAASVQRLPDPVRSASTARAASAAAHDAAALPHVAPASAFPAIASVPSTLPVPALSATLAAVVPAARPATTTVALAVASPTLIDAQPVLTQLLQLLQSGNGEHVLRLLEPAARRAPGAQQLSRNYDQLVHGERPVQLSQVDFDGESRDGVLLVTGRIRLHAGEPTIGAVGQLLVLRAEFVRRGGKVTLTALSGATD